MAAIFHEAGLLAGTRFLSCEDAMNGPAGPVYNPFGAASGLVILACPAHLAARWSQLALPRGPGLAVLVPFSLMFLHNLFHHTFGPPALEIETFAAMMLVFAVPTMSDAPATLWRGSATVAAGVLGAGLADVLGGSSLQQVVNEAAMAVMLPLIELLMSGWRRPSGGAGGRRPRRPRGTSGASTSRWPPCCFRKSRSNRHSAKSCRAPFRDCTTASSFISSSPPSSTRRSRRPCGVSRSRATARARASDGDGSTTRSK